MIYERVFKLEGQPHDSETLIDCSPFVFIHGKGWNLLRISYRRSEPREFPAFVVWRIKPRPRIRIHARQRIFGAVFVSARFPKQQAFVKSSESAITEKLSGFEDFFSRICSSLKESSASLPRRSFRRLRQFHVLPRQEYNAMQDADRKPDFFILYCYFTVAISLAGALFHGTAACSVLRNSPLAHNVVKLAKTARGTRFIHSGAGNAISLSAHCTIVIFFSLHYITPTILVESTLKCVCVYKNRHL